MTFKTIAQFLKIASLILFELSGPWCSYCEDRLDSVIKEEGRTTVFP